MSKEIDWSVDASGKGNTYSYTRLNGVSHLKWKLHVTLKNVGKVVNEDFLNNGETVVFPGLNDGAEDTKSEGEGQTEDEQISSTTTTPSKWNRCDLFEREAWDTVTLKALVSKSVFQESTIQDYIHNSAELALLLVIESPSTRYKKVLVKKWADVNQKLSKDSSEDDGTGNGEYAFDFNCTLDKKVLANQVVIRPIVCLQTPSTSPVAGNSKQKGQILAEGQAFTLFVDKPKKGGTGALNVQWVNFAETNAFNDCLDALYNLQLDDDLILRLNSGHERMKQLFDTTSQSGQKKDARMSYFNSIAADVTFDMLRWAVNQDWMDFDSLAGESSATDEESESSGASKLVKDILKFAQKDKKGLGYTKEDLAVLAKSGHDIDWKAEQKIKTRIQQYFASGKSINNAVNTVIFKGK